MPWKPDHQQAVCERMRVAAGFIRNEGHGMLRRRVALAAQEIHVLKQEEFPRDYWDEFESIVAQLTDNGSIEETVDSLDHDTLTRTAEKIVRLHVHVCGRPLKRNAPGSPP